jgi:hypothetical protein
MDQAYIRLNPLLSNLNVVPQQTSPKGHETLRMESQASLEQRRQDLLISDARSLPGYLDSKNRLALIHYETIPGCFGPKATR